MMHSDDAFRMPLGNDPEGLPVSDDEVNVEASCCDMRLICWFLGANGKWHDADFRHIPVLQSAAVAEFYVWLNSLCARFSSQSL